MRIVMLMVFVLIVSLYVIADQGLPFDSDTFRSRMIKNTERYSSGDICEDEFLEFIKVESKTVIAEVEKVKEVINAELLNVRGAVFDASGYCLQREYEVDKGMSFFIPEAGALPAEWSPDVRANVKSLKQKTIEHIQISPVHNAIIALKVVFIENDLPLDYPINYEICSSYEGGCLVSVTNEKYFFLVDLTGSLKNGWLPVKISVYTKRKAEF